MTVGNDRRLAAVTVDGLDRVVGQAEAARQLDRAGRRYADRIVAGAAVERVGPVDIAGHQEGVIAGKTVQNVVAAFAVNDIGIGRAIEGFIAVGSGNCRHGCLLFLACICSLRAQWPG